MAASALQQSAWPWNGSVPSLHKPVAHAGVNSSRCADVQASKHVTGSFLVEPGSFIPAQAMAQSQPGHARGAEQGSVPGVLAALQEWRHEEDMRAGLSTMFAAQSMLLHEVEHETFSSSLPVLPVATVLLCKAGSDLGVAATATSAASLLAAALSSGSTAARQPETPSVSRICVCLSSCIVLKHLLGAAEVQDAGLRRMVSQRATSVSSLLKKRLPWTELNLIAPLLSRLQCTSSETEPQPATVTSVLSACSVLGAMQAVGLALVVDSCVRVCLQMPRSSQLEDHVACAALLAVSCGPASAGPGLVQAAAACGSIFLETDELPSQSASLLHISLGMLVQSQPALGPRDCACIVLAAARRGTLSEQSLRQLGLQRLCGGDEEAEALDFLEACLLAGVKAKSEQAISRLAAVTCQRGQGPSRRRERDMSLVRAVAGPGVMARLARVLFQREGSVDVLSYLGQCHDKGGQQTESGLEVGAAPLPYASAKAAASAGQVWDAELLAHIPMEVFRESEACLLVGVLLRHGFDAGIASLPHWSRDVKPLLAAWHAVAQSPSHDWLCNAARCSLAHYCAPEVALQALAQVGACLSTTLPKAPRSLHKATSKVCQLELPGLMKLALLTGWMARSQRAIPNDLELDLLAECILQSTNPGTWHGLLTLLRTRHQTEKRPSEHESVLLGDLLWLCQHAQLVGRAGMCMCQMCTDPWPNQHGPATLFESALSLKASREEHSAQYREQRSAALPS